MSEVRQLLEKIARDLGKPAGSVDPIVTRLEGEWYDSLASLKALSDEDWDTLGVPRRLVGLIKERLDEPLQVVDLDENQFNFSVEMAPPFNRFPDEPLGSAVEGIALELEGEALKVCIQTLLKLIDNILNDSQNEKKRKIKFSNPKIHEKIGRFSSAVKVLELVGFGRYGDDFVCETAYLSRLHEARSALEGLVVKMGGSVPPLQTFNPFQQAFSSVHPTLNSVGGSAVRARVAAQVEEDKKLRSQLQDKACEARKDVPLNPKVFESSFFGGSIAEAKKAAASGLEETDDAALVLEQMAKIQQSLQMQQTFRRKNDGLEKVKNDVAHSKTTIRIILPDKLVLQLEFSPYTSILKLGEALDRSLSPAVLSGEWYVFESPPFKKIDFSKNVTLLSLGMVPTASLRLSATAPPPFLVSELMASVIGEKREEKELLPTGTFETFTKPNAQAFPALPPK